MSPSAKVAVRERLATFHDADMELFDDIKRQYRKDEEAGKPPRDREAILAAAREEYEARRNAMKRPGKFDYKGAPLGKMTTQQRMAMYKGVAQEDWPEVTKYLAQARRLEKMANGEKTAAKGPSKGALTSPAPPISGNMHSKSEDNDENIGRSYTHVKVEEPSIKLEEPAHLPAAHKSDGKSKRSKSEISDSKKRVSDSRGTAGAGRKKRQVKSEEAPIGTAKPEGSINDSVECDSRSKTETSKKASSGPRVSTRISTRRSHKVGAASVR